MSRPADRGKLFAMYLKLGFGLALLALLLVFAVQNADPVRVHFISWNVELSQSLLLLLALVAGVLTGFSMSSWLRWRRRRGSRKSRPPASE